MRKKLISLMSLLAATSLMVVACNKGEDAQVGTVSFYNLSSRTDDNSSEGESRSSDQSASDSTDGSSVDVTITHTLDRDFFGIKQADYSTYKTYTVNTDDGATYEAYAAGNNGIQIKSKTSDSGVIGHFDGRTCKSITFTFDVNTEVPNQERKVNIYASNNSFTIEDMFGSSITNVGSITFDKNNLTQTYTFTNEYSYIGFRSDNGAVYLPSVQIVW